MKLKQIGAILLFILGLGIALAGGSKPYALSQAQPFNGKELPLVIKERITRMKEELEKDADRFPSLIRELEAFTAACTDSAGAAVLHSMTAEMYQTYYRRNQWKINQRTSIGGTLPEDMREWSGNLFTDKIREELTASLRPAALLQATPVSGYQVLLAETEKADYLYSTLFDFLSQRAIDLLPDEAFYRAWIDFRQGQPDRRAALVTELNYLEYHYGKLAYTKQTYESYKEALDSLLQLHRSGEYSNEIRIAQVDALDRYRFIDTKEDSVLTRQVEICREGIRLFPNYPRTNRLKNRLKDMESPSLSISNPGNVYPGGELKLQINYRNLTNLTIRIYRSKRSLYDTSGYAEEDSKRQLGGLVKQVSVLLNPRAPYLAEDTTIRTAVPAPGLYEYVVTSSKQDLRSQSSFSVSRIASVSRTVPGGGLSIYAADFQSGKPIVRAAVVSYTQGKRKWLAQDTLYTDNDGMLLVNKNRKWSHYRIVLPADTASAVSSLAGYSFPAVEEEEERPSVQILTDRTIYRPGQTVFFKGIAYVRKTDAPVLLSGRKFTVRFRDANQKEITHKEFTSSDYGSFHGAFTLPTGSLNGYYSLETEGGSTSISVEEYKRPGFKLEMDPVRGEASFDSPLELKGRAMTFSGVPLNGGTVEYRILRHPLLRSYYGGNTDFQAANGEVSVETGGYFRIPFTPRKEEENPFFYPAFYQYELIARLTDRKGETQEERSFFAVGETGFFLSIELPETTDRETASLKIKARTANDKEKSGVPGELHIYKLTGKPGETQKEGACVIQGAFTTGQPIGPEIFSQLPSGAYRVKAEAKDSLHRTVKTEQDFVLYGKEDKKPPVYTPLWVVPGKTDYLPGEEVAFTFGTSEKAYLLYELFSSKECLKREIFRLEEENRTLHFPYPKDLTDGLTVSLSFIKDGKLENRQVSFRQKQPDHTLTIEAETFRDHLRPGSKETWKFRIRKADSTGVAAEMAAALYDASLDRIKAFAWSFQPWTDRTFYLPNFLTSTDFRTRYATTDAGRGYTYLPVPEIGFYRLDWQGALEAGYGIDISDVRAMGAGRSRSFATRQAKTADLAVQEGMVLNENEVMTLSAPSAPEAQSPVRRNLQETAFFYPVLQTDSAGQVIVNFTLPESNTTWKLQALAHTKALEHGILTREVLSQKPLMVEPHLPRFLREGDRVTILSRLMNQSEGTAGGQIRLEWFDPATEEPIATLNGEGQSFSLAQGGDSVFSWTAQVPEGIDLIGCRIVADSKSYSDGEQHLLPILSRQVSITESKPFYWSGEGVKTIDEPSVAAPYRLTLELSANPIGYAVQALPTLGTPADASLVSLFASYYSRTLAASLAKTRPEIRRMVSQWETAGGNSETLLSNLYKNEELKNILLEETPWVMEARNETEQKQRLSLLFDPNLAESQQSAVRQKLIGQQRPDGSWSWFEGFSGDRNLTLYLLRGMAQLTELNAVEYTQEEKEMQRKAIQYLDGEISREYALVQKAGGKEAGVLSSFQLNYLVVRSAFRDLPEDGKTREAIRYYTGRAAANWKEVSLYGKALTALLLHRNGEKQAAQTILEWLRKTATFSEDKGMYWANNRQSSDFFFSPVDTHCLLLSVFHQLSPDRKETDRLKQWLLTQKRTQDWSSVPSTVNAVYALLLTGTDWLKEPNRCTVDWRGKTFDTGGEAGTGYFKQQEEIRQGMPPAAPLRIRKEGSAPAWGALYVQYKRPFSEIRTQAGDLSIDRKLFIEQIDANGRKIVPLAAGKTLKVGDRVVVRLTVRSHTALNYVYLKDLFPGCMEPAEQLSGAEHRDGVWYYRSPRDASQQFFFDRLPAGTFVLEYTLDVSRPGRYSGGLSTLQCLYAPEYTAHYRDATDYVSAEMH